uniref:Uncharacterized protein n=2 Tax=viral metagenome TaxID=1070528 RepID=A0A6H1ZU92_9ZZZZ
MLTVLNVVLILFAGVVLAIMCVCFGGWMVFKSKTAGPGTPFMGRPPKGEVFTVPTEGAEDWPEEDKIKGGDVLERWEGMLSKLGGGKS